MAITETLLVTFSYQQTPLHVAASNGRDYTVECLVKKGAYINIKDKNGVCETKVVMIAKYSAMQCDRKIIHHGCINLPTKLRGQ